MSWQWIVLLGVVCVSLGILGGYILARIDPPSGEPPSAGEDADVVDAAIGRGQGRRV